MSDRQRNIYYRNVYHCYQFVLASIYINIYFVLASIYSSIFWDFSSISWFWRSNKTEAKIPVYRYYRYIFSGIPIPEFSHTEHPYKSVTDFILTLLHKYKHIKCASIIWSIILNKSSTLPFIRNYIIYVVWVRGMFLYVDWS